MRKRTITKGLIFLSWLFFSSILSAPLALSQASPAPPSSQVLGAARISLIQGDVVIQTKDTGDEWGAAAINTPLVPGDRIWDPERGRLELQFFGGSYLRASESTEVDITNLGAGSSGDIIQVGVPQGRTYISYAGSGAQNSVFQADSPSASIMSYEPSTFTVDVFQDGYTEVSVLRGSVYVQGQRGGTRVDAGTLLSMGSDQNAELSPLRPADAWLSWNESRDSVLASAGPSRSYLSASLGVYAHDFDVYGRWVETPDYGRVWTPAGIAAGWAPYSVGRWCWIGGDYVWVSYEPWGWVPFHYGRWAFAASIGWFWVPPPFNVAVSWCPGFVAWVDGPGYVSWVPLAPGEIYYGYGYYGPNSVNITTVNINRIHVTNVFVNARVRNAVRVVSRETFLTGRRVAVVNAPANPFATVRTGASGARIAFGRPDIRPVRATALPNPVKAVSERGLPPRAVQAKARMVLDRRVAVHRDVSVFRPGERVAQNLQAQRLERPRPLTAVERHGLPQALATPPGHRETGMAPRFKEQSNVPSRRSGAAPAQRPEMRRPETRTARPPVQRPEQARPPVRREQMPAAPQERRQMAPPPSGHRETGVAPQFGDRRSGPPSQGQRPNPFMQRREMNAPQSAAKPPPAVPRREFQAPQRRREMSAPPSMHRQTGIAPQFRERSNPPQAGGSRMNSQPPRPMTRPQGIERRPAGPGRRPEPPGR